MFKKGSLALNSISNISFFLINILVLFWFTPFLVTNLGVQAYGYVPLLTNFIGYMTLLTIVFNSMVVRFITIELKNENFKAANEYFNTSFYVSIIFSLCLLPLLALITFWLDEIIAIPTNLKSDIQFLFIAFGINLIFNTIMSPFSTATFYANRFDIKNGIAIIDLFLKTFTTVILFNIFSSSLKEVGIAYVVAAAATLILTIVFSNNLMPGIKLEIKSFSVVAFKRLLNSGIWNAISQIGVILSLSIDLLIANMIIGPVAAGKYAVMLIFPNLIRSFNNSLSSTFAPTILHLYAEGKSNELNEYIRKAIKWVGVILAIPIGILMGFGDDFLEVWVGKDFSNLYLLLIILLAQLPVGLSTSLLGTIFVATNKVKYPALITTLFGIIHLVLSIVLAQTSLGLYGIAISSALTLLLKNSFFFPLMAAKLLNYSWWTFLLPIKDSIVVTLITVTISITIKHYLNGDGWLSLLLGIAMTFFIVILLIGLIITNKEERMKLLSWSKIKFQK